MNKYNLKFVLAYLIRKTGINRIIRFSSHGVKYHFHNAGLAMYLFANRNYVADDVAFLDKTLKEGDVFIDIGANIGTWTLRASKLVKSTGKVLSFEPHPLFHKFLCENILLNKFNNIHNYNVGLSENKSTLYFSNNFDTMNHVLLSKANDCIEVKVEKLDQYTKEIQIIHLIKIDVEGYELFVFKGSIDTLKKTKKIFFESDSTMTARFGYTTSELIEFLQNLNFSVYKKSDEELKSKLPNNYSSVIGEDLIAINNLLN